MNKSLKEKVLYPELSYKIIELAYEVHNHLGPGFTEDIYEKAFIKELRRNHIPFEEQTPIALVSQSNKTSPGHSNQFWNKACRVCACFELNPKNICVICIFVSFVIKKPFPSNFS